eukprot:757037-Hanusia_phi.AAC.3
MLSFDIETMGLDPSRHDVTVAAVYDPQRGIKHCYNFARHVADHGRYWQEVEAFLAALDGADLLCAFNGIKFDIPFIQVRFKVSPERVAGWVVKTVDLFYRWKVLRDHTFSLDSLLIANGLPVKTSKGCFAIDMARDKRWEELEDYCMNDTVLTHMVSVRPSLVIPERRTWR